MTILLVTRSTDDHGTPRVEAALRRRGADVFRLDTDRFPGDVRLAFDETGHATLIDGPRRLAIADVTAVWHRRYDVGARLSLDIDPDQRRVALAEARLVLDDLLRALPAFAIDPMPTHEAAARKGRQLTLAREVGLRVPRTVIGNDPAAVRALAAACPDGIVTKMMHFFMLDSPEGTASLFTTPVTDDDLAALDDGLPLCPMTFQERIEKAREHRVTVVGDRLWSAAIDSQSRDRAKTDWRREGHAMITEWRPARLPTAVEEKLRALMTRLGLVYGAIDLIETPEGEHVFLEVNPAGEYFWLEDICGFPISDAIAERLIAA